MAETITRTEVSEDASNVGPASIPSTLSDRQLLEQFVQSNSDPSAAAAFATLVDRHGPMVLRVCRHVLDDAHAAQDAFQAAFMILACQASSIRKYDSTASWLYGVAYRVAIRARADSLRRQAHEQRYAKITTVNSLKVKDHPDESWEDLYKEIASLPEKLRLPVVLCYLEGLTADAVANQLGCPRGTVLSRLSRARERLRDSLTRRGLAIPAVLLASGIISQTANAAIPVNISQSVIQAALMIAAGKTAAQAVSSPVATLTQTSIKTLWIMKIQTVVAIILLSAGGLAMMAAATIFAFPSSPFSPESNSVASVTTELDAICQAWDESASKIVGELMVRVTNRQLIGNELKKVYSSRPSIERSNPAQYIYVKHRKPIETKFVVKNQVAPDQFRVEKFEEFADRSLKRVLVSTWRPKTWTNTTAGWPDPLLNQVFLQYFGAPYPSTFYYVSGLHKYTTLIKDRDCTLEKEGKLFKIHAPFKQAGLFDITYFNFWLDPAKGMMPVRIERGILDGPPEIRVDNELQQIMPGVWAPVQMMASSMIQDRDSTYLGAVYRETDYRVDLTASQFGNPPDTSVFTQPIPAEVEVMDWIEGTAENSRQHQAQQQSTNPGMIGSQPARRSSIAVEIVIFLAIMSGLAVWFLRGNRAIKMPNRKTLAPRRTAANPP